MIKLFGTRWPDEVETVKRLVICRGIAKADVGMDSKIYKERHGFTLFLCLRRQA
jgi:hypothetical protein